MIRISTKEVQEFEKKHQNILESIVNEGTVLLKKDNTLPLLLPCKTALFGSGARKTIKGGTGSGDISIRHLITIEEGLENRGFEIVSKKWLDDYDKLIDDHYEEWIKQIQKEAKEAGMHSVLYAMGKIMPTPEYDFDIDYDADLAIYVLSRNSGEGADRNIAKDDVYLTDTEIKDILRINEKYKKFILVLNVGGYVDISPVSTVKNILLLSQLGTVTGNVFADILLGKSCPSGKLTMTWADIYDYPSTKGFKALSDVYYNEGIYVGYRYFLTENKKYQYPFGFGLSYTEFDYKYLSCSLNNETITLSVDVKNTGNYKGKEVIQVYSHAQNTGIDKPYAELLGFKKTKELNKNEKETITVSFSLRQLSDFDGKRNANVIFKGDYLIKVGNSSISNKTAFKIHVTEDILSETFKKAERKADITDYVPSVKNEEEFDGETINISSENIKTVNHCYKEEIIKEKKTEKMTFDEVISDESKLDDFINTLSAEQLASLCIGRFKYVIDENTPLNAVGESGSSVAGSAGETASFLFDYNVPTLIMADGPAGLRLNEKYIILNGTVKGFDSKTPGAEFLTKEEKAYLEMIMPKPTKEELEATIYYQYTTAIPVGTAIAQSFNEEIAETCGDIVGEEMEMFGIHLWLAPALNIMRNPLCGRNFEYYSEDPYLSGKIAAGICKGVKKHKGCSTVIKHFACNNQETNRPVSNSVVSERALRNIYLKGFETAVKEGRPLALMTANNLINGIHACSDYDLLNNILRCEWGFDGLVMTDWFVTNKSMISPFKGSDYTYASAYECVKATNDITMPGDNEDKQNILDAYKDNKLTRNDLARCAKHVLKVICSLYKTEK